MSYVSPALERMAQRAALPIKVHCHDEDVMVVEVQDGPFSIVVNPSDATEAYFDFVALLSPAPSSPAGVAADCSASSPLGMR